MGTRQLAQPRKRIFRRHGTATKAEKAFVAQFIADQPTAITPQQERSLAKTMRRSKDLIRSMIEEARENFVAGAQDYVDIHKQATAGALRTMDFDAALKGSQWALEHISAEGARIVDPPKAMTGPTGPRIQIGIKVGGIDSPVTEIALPTQPVIEGEKV